MAADKKKSGVQDVRVERVNDASERKKALAAALSYIEKEFGKGSIMRMSDSNRSEDVEVVSTGSLGLDLALGVGGLPRGRVIEVFGPGKPPARRRSPCRSSPKCRRSAVPAPSSTPSTRSTCGYAQKSWRASSMSSSSRSPTRANRPLRSPTRSCARARST